jgi:outer membrane protein OmpA-like peptidoglycan-associated protein
MLPLALTGRRALADDLRPELRAAIGAGAMASAPQRAQGYDTTFVPELRPGLRFARAFAAELAFASWNFPATGAAAGRATLLGAGLRYDPHLTERLVLFVDAHAGVGLTGPQNRFMFDAGGGLEYSISSAIACGPFVRYGQVADERTDPKFVAGGILLTLAWPGEQAPTPPPARPVVAQSAAPAPAAPAPAAPPPIVATVKPQLLDSDNDGLRDEQDRCPNEPRGPTPDPQRPGCPDGDDDKDGVSNGIDNCRQQQAGLHPDPVAMGCPLGDRDRDAVPDLYDTCPEKPGAPAPEPQKNGCPGLVQIDGATIKITKPVAFTGTGDEIARSSFPVLEAVASALRLTAGIRKVSIEGHTDGQGAPEANVELSTRRAESVVRWLTERGIASDRLQAKGHGDARPIATNRTSKGRAENRRIEFVIIDPSVEKGPTP